MQISITNIVCKIFVLITALFLVGCASDPVPTYLPTSHPAHPEAAEAVYTASPDPFKDDLSKNKMPSDEIPDNTGEAHGGHHSHPMKSDDKKHEKSAGTETEKSGHQHKEHK